MKSAFVAVTASIMGKAADSQFNDALKEARSWIQDIGADERNLSVRGTVLTIHSLYDGGWPAFVAADSSLDVAQVWLGLSRATDVEFANKVNP